MNFSHDPQHNRLLDELNLATRGVPITAEQTAEPDELVVAGAPSVTGLQHGELATVHLEDVEVRGGKHFFCNSRDGRIVQTRQRGDGQRLQRNVRCSIGVNRLPAVDGWYNVLLDITNNNGSVDGNLSKWLDQETGEEIPATREVVGASA